MAATDTAQQPSPARSDRFPRTPALSRSVAMLEALDYGHLFGAGTPDSPLLSVSVQLTGENGNAVSIMRRVERAVRTHLKESGVPAEHWSTFVAEVGIELRAVANWDEFLLAVTSLVEVS